MRWFKGVSDENRWREDYLVSRGSVKHPHQASLATPPCAAYQSRVHLGSEPADAACPHLEGLSLGLALCPWFLPSLQVHLRYKSTIKMEITIQSWWQVFVCTTISTMKLQPQTAHWVRVNEYCYRTWVTIAGDSIACRHQGMISEGRKVKKDKNKNKIMILFQHRMQPSQHIKFTNANSFHLIITRCIMMYLYLTSGIKIQGVWQKHYFSFEIMVESDINAKWNMKDNDQMQPAPTEMG